MSINSFIKSADNITVYVNGKPYNIESSHVNYDKIIAAVKNNQYDLVPGLTSLSKAVKKYLENTPNSEVTIDVDAGTVSYQGHTLHNCLVDRILDMMKDGFDINPMKKLLGNLYKNPSSKAVDELYSFLEYGKMPITPDGCFLAYKRVNADYTSVYDGKTDNSIGKVVEMPRNMVDDRSENTCSHGLHICSFEYLQHYSGDKVIVVKVNPADVVSIPTDYNNTKARVCRYEVINELTFEEAGLPTHSFGTSVYVDEFEVVDVEDEDNSDVVELLQDTLLEVAIQKDEADTQSYWFKLGYSNGYTIGINKKPLPPEVTANDDFADTLTAQNILDVNSGFKLGYKDGRGHKSRKYPFVANPYK